MKLLDKSQSKGDGANFEDIGNHVGNFAWVLDGATALVKRDDNPYTPSWLVKEADKVLAEGAKTSNSLRELIDYYLKNFPIPDDLRKLDWTENPNFAMAIIYADDKHIEYAALADCYVVIKQADNVITYTEPKWEKLTEEISKKRFFIEKTIEERHAVYKTIRQNQNKEDGYWIGTADGEGLQNLNIQRMDISSDAQFILCSDGFERAVSIFELYDWPTIFDANLEQVTADLRHAENTLLDKTKYPREKNSDDVFALKLEL